MTQNKPYIKENIMIFYKKKRRRYKGSIIQIFHSFTR
jgi:hypothetical protein